MSERTLYLFNPENDLALATGCANYTPAPNVREFHAAGAMLPLWCSKGVAATLLGDTVHSDWVARKCGEFGFSADVCCRCDGARSYSPAPWGWSANTVRQFVKAGVDRSSLPPDSFVDGVRRLSHRRSAAWLARQLVERLDYPLPAVPVEAVTVEQVVGFAAAHDGCFIKSPWSGSGRGVVDSTLIPLVQLRNLASGIIRRQGSVLVEQRLAKVLDFAMLFHFDNAVRHIGYSLFFNETANAYGGNRVMSDVRIGELVESKVGAGVLHRLSSALMPLLDELLAGSGYKGYFGVDMMVYQGAGGKMLVCPTVELNLRMTMGIVAWHIARDILAPDVAATLRVRYAPSGAAGDKYVISGGRITDGTINLIPPHPAFRITLSVD